MGLHLISGGPTSEFIDPVRIHTNKYHGNTGCYYARYFADKGEKVVLVNSNKAVVELRGCLNHPNIEYIPFVTFDDLDQLMCELITSRPFDSVIHSAAVSDDTPTGVFYMDENEKLVEIDRSTKIKSDEYPVKYVQTMVTPKIVDKFRGECGYDGIIVKHKLQTNKTDSQLLRIMRESMHHSEADWMVGNCDEWADVRAFIMDARDDSYVSVARNDLPAELYRRIVG